MAIVAWPPPTPPNTRQNVTPELDNHPSDHNRIADALDTIIDRLTPPAWVALTVNTPWQNVANHQAAQYRRVGDMVQIRGDVQSGNNGSTIATLPVGYRPPATIDIAVSVFLGGTVAGMLQLLATGALTYFGSNAPSEIGLNFQFSVTP